MLDGGVNGETRCARALIPFRSSVAQADRGPYDLDPESNAGQKPSKCRNRPYLIAARCYGSECWAAS